jgi:hypothetical protein
MHIDHPILNKLMGPRTLTHTLEWNIRLCVIERMFDSEYRVDPRFLARYMHARRDAHATRRASFPVLVERVLWVRGPSATCTVLQ